MNEYENVVFWLLQFKLNQICSLNLKIELRIQVWTLFGAIVDSQGYNLKEILFKSSDKVNSKAQKQIFL